MQLYNVIDQYAVIFRNSIFQRKKELYHIDCDKKTFPEGVTSCSIYVVTRFVTHYNFCAGSKTGKVKMHVSKAKCLKWPHNSTPATNKILASSCCLCRPMEIHQAESSLPGASNENLAGKKRKPIAL
jgi:hypothetical protein